MPGDGATPDAALVDATAPDLVMHDASALPDSAAMHEAGGDMTVDAAHAGDRDSGQVAPPPKTYAELCPGASPGAGIPAPVAGAQPVRIDSFSEYLESPIAAPGDFGLMGSSTDATIELIENQPDPYELRLPVNVTSSDRYSADTTNAWPAWLGYRFDSNSNAHVITIGRGLRRGTYHVSVPLWHDWMPAPGPYLSEKAQLELIVRVKGLGFTRDRLAVPHYVGDSANRVLSLTLAGGDSRWRITDLPSWLQVSQTEAGSLDHVDLQFSRNASFMALAPGHYEARLCVENARGDGATIPVYALVERPSLRPLHTQRLLYDFASSDQLSSYTYVFTDLQAEVAWQGASSQPWLILQHDTGTTNQRLDFRVDPTGLPEGRHTAELTFSDPSGKHESARVVVHYLKDNRLSRWPVDAPTPVASSPITPDIISVLNAEVDVIDIFGGHSSLSLGTEGVAAVVVSEYSRRLHVLSDWRTNILRSYSWPDLTALATFEVAAQSNTPLTGPVERVLGQEYWILGDAVVDVADGRSGPMLAARSNNRARPRIYDDGTTLFGFEEDLGEPVIGDVHWAHSANSFCGYRGDSNQSVFQCEDPAGVYLSVDPEPQPKLPFLNDFALLTHQGGVYFANFGSEQEMAFDASGRQIQLFQRLPPVSFIALWGDTLRIGNRDGEALNYLFEPQHATPLPPIAPNDATCPASAGQVIATRDLQAAQLVADPVRDRMYALVGGTGLYAGELVTLNGSTGAILSHVDLGALPSHADIAFDGSVLWVVLGNPPQLRRVDLSGDEPVPGALIPPPPLSSFDPERYLGDLAVGTGTTDTVVVSFSDGGQNRSIALYMDGVLRDVSPAAADSLVPGPFGYFFGSQDTTTLLRVDDRHLNQIGSVANASQLHYQQDRLIAVTSGYIDVLDVHDPERPSTLMNLPSADVALPDIPKQRVWALIAGSNRQAIQLVENNLDTATSTSTPLNSTGYPKDFVRTASGCFAFLTGDGDQTTLVLFAPPR